MYYSCYVSFHFTDGDRELMVSMPLRLPPHAIAIGVSLNYEPLRLIGVIGSLEWFGDGVNDRDTTDVDVYRDVVPNTLDEIYARCESSDLVDYCELSRDDSVIEFEPSTSQATE